MSAGNSYSQQPIPLVMRKSVLTLNVVMFGLTFFSASMRTGGTLGTGLNCDDFSLVVLLGSLMFDLYTAVLGLTGAHTGLSTHLLAHYSFSSEGSWLSSTLLSGTQVGWFGVGIAMFAILVAKATGLNVNLLTPASGTLTTLTVSFGIAGLILLSAIATPVIVVPGSCSVQLAVRDIGGLVALQQVMPSAPLSLSTAIVLVVGSSVSAGILIAGFVYFDRNACTAAMMYLMAFLFGDSLMLTFDAAGVAAVGKSDISDVVIAQGLLIPAILVLGLNVWITNDNALYASGLSFANITGLSSRFLAMLNDALDTLTALWSYSHFVGWLTFLFTAIPPIDGAIIADYLSRRRRHRQHPYTDIQAINWVAILAVARGIATSHWLPGIMPVNAVLGAVITYLLFNPLLSRNPNKPEEALRTN